MTLDLPKPVANYFEADQGKGEHVAQCFTPDAVVEDEGHTYRGTDEIRSWRANIAAQFTYTCEPLTVHQMGDQTVVTCRLEGDFPGGIADLRFRFRPEGDKIAELKIAP